MTIAQDIRNISTVYYVTYRFHLVEHLRAKTKLPKVIERTVPIEADSVSELAAIISTALGRCVKLGGILGDNPLVSTKKGIVLPNVTKDLMNFDLGIFIPGHMIAYIETITTIKPLQPGADPDDTEVPIQ